ncbi:hypothetical protein MPLDJ20_110323 [Mesorhizobium plurifarium]|uniref:Uncharacterized protein n=1 Tax=Mesorhizobium plurifarium TaxID=69974 RepID=A0A090FNJ6_MESPL|nr:hypothetical protein MPLDJ20_110323 [Mesorhizobium plurifarium]
MPAMPVFPTAERNSPPQRSPSGGVSGRASIGRDPDGGGGAAAHRTGHRRLCSIAGAKATEFPDGAETFRATAAAVPIFVALPAFLLFGR